MGTKHVITSTHYLATMAGLRMFALGGNAADAGVAAAVALNVLERHLTDFGGVAPIMFFRPGMPQPAEGEVFDTYLLPQMFALAATDKMSPEDAAKGAEQQIEPIFDKWKGRGLV